MSLRTLLEKKSKLVIGLMGGTSVDGVDAALVRIDGYGLETRLQQLGYISIPFESDVRTRILQIAQGACGGSREIARMHTLLGELYADACIQLCRLTGTPLESIDLIGSHGQTVYHQPNAENYFGKEIAATYQIGEPSVLCEKIGAVVVSDFRVRDLAAGGQGAPLVPYTEYLLYRQNNKDIALQNIGGMGNITFLPQGGKMSELIAFDTGPGNVLIDAIVEKISDGRKHYDDGGALAAKGKVNRKLLQWLLDDEYLRLPLPKTTGREKYDLAYQENLCRKAEEFGLSKIDLLATVTRYTAETIADAVHRYLPRRPAELIVGGGGSHNGTLMRHLRELLPDVRVRPNEELGWNSDAKEAIAFAILANEALHGQWNNVPAVTGAAHPVVMGKISQ